MQFPKEQKYKRQLRGVFAVRRRGAPAYFVKLLRMNLSLLSKQMDFLKDDDVQINDFLFLRLTKNINRVSICNERQIEFEDL